jgi:hypothetical protein
MRVAPVIRYARVTSGDRGCVEGDHPSGARHRSETGHPIKASLGEKRVARTQSLNHAMQSTRERLLNFFA